MLSEEKLLSEFEYVERFYDFRKTIGYYPTLTSLTGDNNWDECQKLAFKAMAYDLNNGWSVVQDSFGPYCFKYTEIGTGYSSEQWLLLIILALVTFGIGLILVLFMRGGKKISLTGFTVKLRRRRSIIT